jgi:hypothetical protein
MSMKKETTAVAAQPVNTSSREDYMKTFQQLLMLLRTALWDAPLPADLDASTIDWNGVVRHAKRQTVGGLIADVVVRHADRLQASEALLQWANRQIAQARQGNLRLNMGVRDVVGKLRAGGIHAVLLKGQGAALNYPQPRLRQCGDIDLYVGRKQYHEAVKLMCELSGDHDGSENDKHYHLQYKGLFIELHHMTLKLYVPWHNRAFQRWTVQSLESDRPRTVMFDDTEVLLPPADYNSIYIFAHAWRHFVLGGVGLRQLCDWVLQLHAAASELHAADVEQRLRSIGLWTPWRICSCLAVEQLGLPAAECPGYEPSFSPRAALALRHIINEGNFGQYDSTATVRPKGYFAGKMHSFRHLLSRISRVYKVSPSSAFQTFPGYVVTGIETVLVRDKIGTQPKSVSRAVIEGA